MAVKMAKKLRDSCLKNILIGLTGKACCRQRVGRRRSLSLGFGDKIPHGRARLIDDFYGEWEIGTYSAAWRIVSKEKLLCGSQDVVDTLEDLDRRLSEIQIGQIESIYSTSKFDVRVDLNNGIHIDFFEVDSEGDEVFHIFSPNEQYLTYSVQGGWKVQNL